MANSYLIGYFKTKDKNKCPQTGRSSLEVDNFSKGPESKYVGFAGNTVSVTTTQLCSWSTEVVTDTHKQTSMSMFQ